MHYSQHRGVESERWALQHLRTKGLVLIEQNYRCKLGEIDLIMRDRSIIQQKILVFVEVRYRRSAKFGGALASITPAKQRRIMRSAQLFCKTHTQYNLWPSRFDVVAISGLPDKLQIAWLRSAFEC